MSSSLDQALGEAQRRADRMVERSRQAHGEVVRGEVSQRLARRASSAVATPQPVAVPSTLGAAQVSTGSLGALGSQQQQVLFHHREQMRHFSGWVFACVRPIAQRIAGQPLRVARKVKQGKRGPGKGQGVKRPRKDTLPGAFKALTDDLDVLEQHPLLDLVNRPNAIMVRWVLLYVTVVCLELTGRAFWWLRKDDKGKWELWPLPPSWVEPVHTEERLYASWVVRPEGSNEPVAVPGEDIVQIYYPDPGNPLGCVAPLQAQARAVVTDEAIVEAQRRGFQNGVNPGTLITVGRHPDVTGVAGQRPVLTREQRAQLISAIKQFYRGVIHHDEPLILDGLIESVSRFTNTPREMDYPSSSNLTKERISQGFGVSPVIMGQLEGANRASSASADDHFCSSTVNPKCTLISECLTAWLGPRFSAAGEELLVYLEPASAYDPDLELSKLRFLQSIGALSLNEARAALGYPPIEGGDVCLIGAQVIPASVVREGSGGVSFPHPEDPDAPQEQGAEGGDGQPGAPGGQGDGGNPDGIDQGIDPVSGS